MSRTIAVLVFGLVSLSVNAQVPNGLPGTSAPKSLEQEIAAIRTDRAQPTHTAHQDLAYNAQFPPSYPAKAAASGHYGTAVVMVMVGADGAIKGMKLEQSTGFRDLDTSAADTIRRWHFFPAAREGAPVDGLVRVPVTYSLPASAPSGGSL